ncbi:Rgg family transcriptional regulator [Streptococcus gallolyticus subsp. gallolyticus]|uniref:helix-turn-helix domain-containing protein n=1 Tax=Streptococcus gallolyticus TaxID=315405 RepID=UPI002097F29E|nr:Rgg/GadR/MutR family transcriptional regulator [Streptococcus gallolyticus]MCO7178022.1 helix-turn-helix domain-containing protein [Streptococcus gallolyticus]
MKHLGKLFKKYRVSRGLTLRDIAEAGISTSQLSRFEQGKTDLTITRLALVLEEMNVPIAEFMHVAGDSQRNHLERLLERIHYYHSVQDIAGLEYLLAAERTDNTANELFQHLNTILIRIYLHDLSKEDDDLADELAYLSEYLFSVENWGCYELLLFKNAFVAFNHKTFMRLSEELSQRTAVYQDLPANRQLRLDILLNGYLMCIERDELSDALYFEKQLTAASLTETELYERLVFHYGKYFYQFKKSQSEQAILEMQNAIKVLTLASSDQLAQKYQKHLERLIGKGKE